MHRFRCLLLAWAVVTLPVASVGLGDDLKAVNTEKAKGAPPPPEQAAKMLTLPRGFQATLFAGEPHVRQPIAMATDDRGRLWVAECYTYAERAVNFAADHRDRIVILEDTNHDGQFDKRTVFWDKAQKLTSIEIGFGGVYALCAPHLLFLPDRDRDDVPDGEPVVVLDGWDDNVIRHNIVNGLKWGPDGWLYGRHGITATSFVGKPGAAREQRTPLNCGIWRYHPTRELFEVVCHGTTNPWGFDYDDHGQMFFTNTVIGHLWHVIPGAHYKRMFGEDLTPRVYDLIDQHADHYHWDTGKKWHETRDGKGLTDTLGGGHAHCGGMIYLGNNWPDQYRGALFTVNLHGRRVNQDHLVRSGSGYVGRHGEDFLKSDDPWFRGIDLIYGPDGGVYLADWSDTGECHENDGVHRTSGRVFKITYGKPERLRIADVAKLTDAELVQLQLEKNDWYVRAARRNLQERAAAGRAMTDVHAALRQMFLEEPDLTRKLRAFWALHVTGGTNDEWLRQLLDHREEHVRVWAIRFLMDNTPIRADTRREMVELAKTERSSLVRLFLTAALQRLPVSARGELAAALLAHRDAGDHNLPLLLWYGIEPLAAADPYLAAIFALETRIPLVRRFLARRLAEEIERSPAPLNRLLLATTRATAPIQRDVLQGMTDGLRGWRKAPALAAWDLAGPVLAQSADKAVHALARELGVVFGDGRALAELRTLAQNPAADGESRRAALRVLIDSRADDLLPVLQKLISDRVTAGVAARGLAQFDHPATPKQILAQYQHLHPDDRPAAVSTLVARPTYARALLQAVAEGRFPRADLSASHARQIQNFHDKELSNELARVWGELRTTPADKLKQIQRYQELLTPERLARADLAQGRALFVKSCAACHKLHGEGGTLSPDLTGSNRDNLAYLLENLIDPGAQVPADYRISVVALKSGRVVTGVVVEPTERTLAVQTQTERIRLERAEIEAIQGTQQSLMPDGLLTALTDDQVRDLIGYLMSPRQVALPAAKP